MAKNIQFQTTTQPAKALRLGFVPLTDCAPLVMAQELGFFRKYGLRVTLHRELGWATIRDKVIHGELEAAHALAAMPVAATLGLGSIKCECTTGMVLNLHGNAITLAKHLRKLKINDNASLRETIRRLRHQRVFTFGAVAPFSSHLFLLRKWLASAGIHPDRDVRIVIVPPPQMAPNLMAGHLDGFCVGEPWNSVAIAARAGWCAAASAELAPGHPEKVLMVRKHFAVNRRKEHVALVAALLEACEYCDQTENLDRLARTLARPEYVGAPEAALRQGIAGEFNIDNRGLRTVPDFAVFHRHDANEPSTDKAAWVMQHLREVTTGLDPGILGPVLSRRVYDCEIFEEAVRLRSSMSSEKTARKEPLLAAC